MKTAYFDMDGTIADFYGVDNWLDYLTNYDTYPYRSARPMFSPSETETLIQDSLEKIMNDGTVIVVAHRLSTIQHANKIYVFNNGQIIEEGTHQELLKKQGRYYLDRQPGRDYVRTVPHGVFRAPTDKHRSR